MRSVRTGRAPTRWRRRSAPWSRGSARAGWTRVWGLRHLLKWAGVIPIVGQARNYCAQYWPNAELVPFYVVQGELDGDKVKDNARDLDRYLIHRFDVTVLALQDGVFQVRSTGGDSALGGCTTPEYRYPTGPYIAIRRGIGMVRP